MKLLGWKPITVATMAALGWALFVSASVKPTLQQPAAPATSEIVLTVDPAQSKVHWTVDSTLHMVHGTFALKGGSVHFDPESGRAGGEIAVYASSGDQVRGDLALIGARDAPSLEIGNRGTENQAL